MIQTVTRDTDPADAPRKGRAVRPRLAATLILYRGGDDGLEVLMGRRAARHGFMPGKFVFPGGRVDRGDTYAPIARPLPMNVQERLCAHLARPRAVAVAAAAVRETMEEAGLKLSAPMFGSPKQTKAFSRFTDHGLGVDLSSLHLIARAITPPYHPKRFDTWFFTAPATNALDDPKDTASGELLDLHWVRIQGALDLDLPKITQMVLHDLQRAGPRPGGDLPFYVSRHGKHLREKL